MTKLRQLFAQKHLFFNFLGGGVGGDGGATAPCHSPPPPPPPPPRAPVAVDASHRERFNNKMIFIYQQQLSSDQEHVHSTSKKLIPEEIPKSIFPKKRMPSINQVNQLIDIN